MTEPEAVDGPLRIGNITQRDRQSGKHLIPC